LAERDRRFSTLQEFADKENLVLVTVAEPADHRQDEEHNRWLAHVSTDLAKPGRCRLCYAHRLLPIARMAKEKGYDCFTTSLLLSIYQDHEGIVSAGEEAASQAGVGFLNMDFRVGYRRSREMARGRHLYMQKYCGCEFSYAPMTMEGPGKR